MNKGQVQLTIPIVLGLITTFTGVSGFFYKNLASVNGSVRDNTALIREVEVKHNSDIVETTAQIEKVNEKLDILLENFDLKYVPKKETASK